MWPVKPICTPLFLFPALLGVVAGPALAQTSPPARAPSAAAAPAPAASAPPGQRVEVTGGRQGDAEQRRQSTAAKIVIGREDIERFGDSSVSEVLRRLPGVTTGGPPGRGGGPRMRGLGGGYTQILIDGQRAPAGFSLDSLTPEQLERIEILRAPTAETGARAIGGTINIVTREGFRMRHNDLRIGLGAERGGVTPGLFYTRNFGDEALTGTVTASLFRPRRDSETETTTLDFVEGSTAPVREQLERSAGPERRVGMNLNARVQWRGRNGDSLLLLPALFTTRGEFDRALRLDQPFGAPPPTYRLGDLAGDNRFTSARLQGTWRTRLGESRAELNGQLGRSNGRNASLRQEFDSAGGLLRTTEERGRSQERTASLSGKLTRLLAGDHNLVAGLEVESVTRDETRVSLQDSRPLLAEFDEDFQASSDRVAVFAQDEWTVSPNWSAHAGLRWEGIVTRGDPGDGTRPRNRSSVATPLLHAVWKPDPRSRDQVRISLTRSYRSPTLQNLVARPSINARAPVPGPNSPTLPDRAGNPELRPELATGVDIAVERYLAEGGVLSANLFARRLTDYIRSVTALETVSWSPVPRYVSRPQNVGDALTAGVELEARFRLDQWVAGAPRVEMRSNVSFFSSRVDGVPGPDNRLDEQPRMTANFGADYRIRGTPLTLGGNLGWTPAYRTQVSADQATSVGVRRPFDAYALWVLGPAAQVRLNVGNLLADDDLTTRTLRTGALTQQSRTVTTTYTTARVALELKL